MQGSEGGSAITENKVLGDIVAGLYVLSGGVLRNVNRHFCTILGYEQPGELIGRYLRDLVHPDDRKSMRLALEKGESLLNRKPLRLIRKNGKNEWVVIGGRLEKEGSRLVHRGAVVSVNSLKSRIDSLQQYLHRYETILNDVDVQLAEMDLDGNLTFVNDAVCKMWGLPPEAMLGRRYMRSVDPETSERFYHVYKHVYETGQPVTNVTYHVNDWQGRRKVIEKSISLARDADGAATGFHMVTRDITARKEADDKIMEHRSRLEAIFSSVKDAIITVDPGWNVIEANKSTEALCGFSTEAMAGQDFAEYRKQCSGGCRDVLRQTLGKQVAVREFRVECDHRFRWQQVVSVSSSPLLDPRGTFMGAVMVIRDITLMREVERELRERSQFQNLIGRNKKMQDIYNLLEDLADLDTTVLVTGESGTGKELVARALHYGGNRAFKPFSTVNCSALPENLLESELFGHVKGAFTGAIKDRQGRFQAADGGTILLDEIGDISPMIQLKLLRVLQEKEFERVGESTPRKVDVRVIASTNRDLREKVAKGEFRQDLFYRLKVVEVHIPPLRERLEDIPLLVDHFRKIFNERFNRSIEGISSDVLGRFMDYDWPGNVRELEHVMEHAFVLCRGGTITMKHLPADIRSYEGSYIASRPSVAGTARHSLEKEDIIDALNNSGWNKSRAARLLGIGRRTIYRKIEDFNITREDSGRGSLAE